MPTTLTTDHQFSAGATRLVHCSMATQLQAGALLTGTPSAVEQTTSDLTIANVAVNDASYVDDETNKTVEVGQAVQFTVAGGSADTTYTVRVTASTDSTPAETLVYDLTMEWV